MSEKFRKVNSKTTDKANEIRIKLNEKVKKGEIDLGVWTPHTLSNRAIIKTYSFLLRKGKR